MENAITSVSPRATRAHALKNCLAVVRAVNQLLESEVSERSRQRISRSQEAVQRMLSLIQEDLSDRRLCGPASSSVAAEAVLRAVVVRIEDRAQTGRVELVVQAGTGGIAGDPAELVEALANVVLNAIQATPEGGTVFVATSELEDGSQLWTVRDTGPGMPEHVVKRLGTPFVSARPGGSGVGFAMARGVVESHGGQIRVCSHPGSGTVVSFHFPSVAAEALSGNAG